LVGGIQASYGVSDLAIYIGDSFGDALAAPL
jgi:hypothetical protein